MLLVKYLLEDLLKWLEVSLGETFRTASATTKYNNHLMIGTIIQEMRW